MTVSRMLSECHSHLLHDMDTLYPLLHIVGVPHLFVAHYGDITSIAACLIVMRVPHPFTACNGDFTNDCCMLLRCHTRVLHDMGMSHPFTA